MPYKLVGRTHDFKGRRLWEIVGHLKDFGAGRMVVRSRFERYPEPCFYRIVKAEPDMDTGPLNADQDNMKGSVLVERIFRGKSDGIVDISKTAYKTDFQLIHKHEEAKYLEAYKKFSQRPMKIYPAVLEMPPLLKIVAEREGHAAQELKLKINDKAKHSRLAEEGEKPTEELSLGLGKPASPELYQGLL